MTRDQRSGGNEHAGLSLHREGWGDPAQSEISSSDRDLIAAVFVCLFFATPVLFVVSFIRYFG